MISRAAITRIWNALPREVRVALLLGLVAAMIAAGIVVAWLAWDSGYVRDRLGIVATTEDLQQQTDHVASAASESVDSAVGRSLRAYDEELRAYLDAERRQAIDTILTPMLYALAELDKRQRQMLSAQDANTRRLDELPKAYNGQLQRLIDATDGDETSRLLRDILERLETIERDRPTDPSIHPPPRRNSKTRL